MLRRTTWPLVAAAAAAAPWNAREYQPGRPGGPRVDATAANAVLRARLEEAFAGVRAPFLVARTSLGAELSISAEYAAGRRRNYSEEASLRSHAGVYGDRRQAEVFASSYAAALNASSVVAAFGADAEAGTLQKLAPRASIVENRAVEPFYFARPWSEVLAGRRVLVVHPFAASIERQYARHRAGDKLWPDVVLPPDMDLVVVEAVSALGGEEPPHGSWAASLQSMEARIDALLPVDVALLGCGAYGLPLARHVVDRGASAIYVGGGLQLLFGIMGRRWEHRPEITAVRRDSWVWPSDDETPPGAAAVEGGAYWR